jgi:hypothetical protein
MRKPYHRYKSKPDYHHGSKSATNNPTAELLKHKERYENNNNDGDNRVCRNIRV